MAARKKKSKFDWGMIAGVITLVFWMLSLCGAFGGVYFGYEAIFNSREVDITTLQLVMGLVATYIPYTIYKLFADLV